MLTMSVWCVFLDLPAKLRYVYPPSCTSRLVQLMYVAQCFLAFCGLLCCGKLPKWRMTLLLSPEIAKQSATYHHGAINMPFALDKVAKSPESCSRRNRVCADVCHGCTHVTDRLRCSGPTQEDAATPVVLACRGPSVAPV